MGSDSFWQPTSVNTLYCMLLICLQVVNKRYLSKLLILYFYYEYQTVQWFFELPRAEENEQVPYAENVAYR